MAENKEKKTLTISTSFNKKLNETNFRSKEKQSFIPEKKNNRTFPRNKNF